MIHSKNINTHGHFLSPDEFQKKINNRGNFKLFATAAYNNWSSLQEESNKIWDAFGRNIEGCYGWADKVHPDGVYVIQFYYRVGSGTRHVYYACVESLMNDKNVFQLMKTTGFDSYDKAMVAGLLLKNLTNSHREEEELTNLTAIFKLMDME